jgi:TonB C terminal
VGGPIKQAHARRAAQARKEARARGEPRARGHLGRGGLVAFLLHVHLLVPLLIATFIYASREEARRAEQAAEEVDVAWENVPPEQLPRELPPLDDTPAPLTKASKQRIKAERPDQDRRRADKKKRELAPKPEEKVAEKPPSPAEPEVTVPPLPAMPEPEAPPIKLKEHEKMVDLDNEKDVEAPPDAKYLAQKNNRADVESRATETNLEREQKGGEGSLQAEGERHDDQEVGDDRAKIAQLEDVKSKLGRKAPDVIPRKEAETPEAPQAEAPARTSPVLSLRDSAPRGHEITPETVDPSLPHDPAGMLATPKPHGAFRDEEKDHRPNGGKRLKLVLSGKDYEYLFGKEAKAERQLAEKERSTRVGKFARATARVRSALENFIPEVKPGNQTALNTRAAPFAAFIARMHRSIHQLWGFGALEDWGDLPSSSPLNDESLMNTLEIVLNRDGTVNKVTPVRLSKYLPYDAAAIDVVYSAGPYPEPPREIRSGDGKIYIWWSFFRDGRQCATSGVEPKILNNGPKGGDLGTGDAEVWEAPPAEPATGPRRLARNLAQAPASNTGTRPRAATGAPRRDEDQVSGTPPPTRTEGLHANDAAAAELARSWFAAYVAGDVPGMTLRASFPFRSIAGVAAKNREELNQMLRSLVAETPQRAVAPVAVETAAGLRRLVGKLPPGLDDGSGALFAVTHTDGDTLILLLAHDAKGWKATGLVRR